MKTLFLTALIVAFMTFGANANVYQQLTSGDLVQIKKAAQMMTAGQENTRENADILAEILSSRYKDDLTTEVDTLAWACKALAATSDGRYRALLVEISKSKVHKKLRKYAKRSYKKLPERNDEQFEKGNISLGELAQKEQVRASKAEVIIPRADLTAKQRKLFAIAKGDLRAIKSLAQVIKDRKSVDPDIGDALSEFLLQNFKQAAEFQADTLAWICRAFGETDQGRYRDVMNVVYRGTNHSKIKSYARDAYLDLPKSETYYTEGQVVLADIVSKFKA